MPPSTSALSPAELSYLHTSLSLQPPIRPDARLQTQFRPLIAETGLLPGTNGSARVCFADGTEAIVGVKAEVEKSNTAGLSQQEVEGSEDDRPRQQLGEDDWVEVSIEIPGLRDDDAMPVFMSSMLREALVADGFLPLQLCINSRFHWRLYVDILLLSPPLSYPLPLLSLTTHLALLSTRLPLLKSEKEEDPLFDDDWEASTYLYPRLMTVDSHSRKATWRVRPPITLLVMSVAENIIFDPTKEELTVAEGVLAVSLASSTPTDTSPTSGAGAGPTMRLLSIRTIDPPSRLTAPGVPDRLNTATGGTASTAHQGAGGEEGQAGREGRVWTPPRGGVKRSFISRVVKMVLGKGGVGQEVMEGVEGVDVG